MSLREEILGCLDLQSEVVEVPEWKIKVELREMTVAQRNKFVKSAKEEDETLGLQLLLNCIFDPATGEQVFEHQDIERLLHKSSIVVDRLGKKILELSGVGIPESELLKRAEKN